MAGAPVLSSEHLLLRDPADEALTAPSVGDVAGSVAVVGLHECVPMSQVYDFILPLFCKSVC